MKEVSLPASWKCMWLLGFVFDAMKHTIKWFVYGLQWCVYCVSNPLMGLTHWGRVTHICVGNLTIAASDNGLSPGRRQAIIWTNDGILLIRTLGTNFSEIISKIHSFSFKKMHLKMSSAKWRLFCLGLNDFKRTWATNNWLQFLLAFPRTNCNQERNHWLYSSVFL